LDLGRKLVLRLRAYKNQRDPAVSWGLIQKVLPEVRTYFITLLSPLVGVLVFFDLTFLKSGWRLAAAVVWSSLAFVDI
jgi:hypothetical protein